MPLAYGACAVPEESPVSPPAGAGLFPDGGHHNGLNGVHPVFRLVKDSAVAGAEHLVRDLPDVHALVMPLLCHLRFKIVERGQAVQVQHIGIFRGLQCLLRHPEGAQQPHPLGNLRLLAHGRPTHRRK